MADKTESSGGLNLSGILTIIFVLCKLFHVINWSWWVVFLPVIIAWSLLLMTFIAVLIVAVFLGVK